MPNRLELQTMLEEKLNSPNVYYQPPSSVNMKYPAIVYAKDSIDKLSANNEAYSLANRYQITVIDKKPDNEVINELLKLPYCSFNRHYVSDNLNHDVLTIYW